MPSLTWKSHPARERPLAAALVTVFIIILMVTVYLIMHSAMMMLLAGAILFISLSTFYMPTTFSIDENKVRIKYLYTIKERNLSAFRQYYPETRGILLSPYLSPSRLENFRGFYLRYGKDNKTQVDAIARELIDAQRTRVGSQNEANTDAI